MFAPAFGVFDCDVVHLFNEEAPGSAEFFLKSRSGAREPYYDPGLLLENEESKALGNASSE